MKKFHSFSDIQSEIRNGTSTVSQVVEHYLEQIAKQDGRLNAFRSVYVEESLESARQIDQRIAAGTSGRLAGMVVGVKDIFSVKGQPVECSSKMLAGFQAQYSATIVQRLLKEDAIIIGHQNCDEFGMGSSSEYAASGPVRNPHDDQRVPGGSSGGSAAAVAAGMCTASVGSDTGGSVRQPAAFCGIVGLKPTYSRISRYGMTAYASSFDTVGLLTGSIADAALLLEVLAGPDEKDSTVSRQSSVSYTQYVTKRNYTVAYLKESMEHGGLNEEVKNGMHLAIESLKAMGHRVEEVSFSLLDAILPTYYLLTSAEASANLARYDGVRYGMRVPGKDMKDMYKKTRSEGFGEEVKRRIMMGTFALSASYYDAYFTKAQQVRRLIKEQTEALLQRFDFIISPTTPTTAFRIGTMTKDPVQMYLEDLYTVLANVTGIPAISVPIGSDHHGMPVGVQFMTKAFNELELLDISNQMITFKDQNN